jgi:hypothetical protein
MRVTGRWDRAADVRVKVLVVDRTGRKVVEVRRRQTGVVARMVDDRGRPLVAASVVVRMAGGLSPACAA